MSCIIDVVLLLPAMQADVQEVASKLSSSRCNLPAHQLQLIEEFRTLVSTLAQLNPQLSSLRSSAAYTGIYR